MSSPSACASRCAAVGVAGLVHRRLADRHGVDSGVLHSGPCLNRVVLQLHCPCRVVIGVRHRITLAGLQRHSAGQQTRRVPRQRRQRRRLGGHERVDQRHLQIEDAARQFGGPFGRRELDNLDQHVRPASADDGQLMHARGAFETFHQRPGGLGVTLGSAPGVSVRSVPGRRHGRRRSAPRRPRLRPRP